MAVSCFPRFCNCSDIAEVLFRFAYGIPGKSNWDLDNQGIKRFPVFACRSGLKDSWHSPYAFG